MSTEIAISGAVPVDDDIYWPPAFAPETAADDLGALFLQHDGEVDTMRDLAQSLKDNPDAEAAVGYLLAGLSRQQHFSVSAVVAALRDPEPAARAVSAAYWDRALRMTDVYDLMPQARRDEWNRSIERGEAPPFTRETVAATMLDLLSSRRRFFAERVDGVFHALSPCHITNRPNGFRERMIFQGVTSFGMVDYRAAGHLHDLRCVIATLLGRPHPSSGLTFSTIEYAVNRSPGAWIDVDAGVLRLRAYKKGTVHVEVEESVARKLNGMLASIHPRAIPPEHLVQRAAPKRKPSVVLQRHPVHPDVLSIVRSMRRARELGETTPDGVAERWMFGSYDVDKHRLAAFRAVMESMGGIVDKAADVVDFDYHAADALDLLLASGMTPDLVSHQYYPTPRDLADKIVWVAGPKMGGSILEPSAGLGALADAIPPVARDRLTCLEIDPLRVAVLRAKGYRVEQADFLDRSPAQGRYDAILMNPPFSGGRWRAHYEHARDLLLPGGCVAAVLPESAASSSDIVGGGKRGGRLVVPPTPFPGTAIRVVVVLGRARDDD